MVERLTQDKSLARIVRVVRRTLLHCAALIGAAVVLAPFAWMVSTSLKPSGEVFGYPPTWIPSTLTLASYMSALRAAPFGRFFMNSTIVAGASTLASVMTSALAAYSFARLRFRGREVLFLLFLGSMMVPRQVTFIPSFLLMKWFSWVNTYLALWIPGAAGGFGIFLLRQFFQELPVELEEAARIDGCTRLGILTRIILPLSKPALATLAIFSFMYAWNDFLWPLLVTTSESMRTVQVGLAMFMGDYAIEWNLLMAAAVLSSLPTVIVFLLFQRYFVRGIAMTGLKG